MKTFQLVQEWKAEARQEDLLRILERRCRTPIPDDLAKVITELFDHGKLDEWLDVAAMVDSLDEFRAGINQSAVGETTALS